MNELEEAWAKITAEAIERARSDGRADVAAYLELKAGNDAIRLAGVQWLYKSFLELSDDANRQGIRLDIENENPHRFSVGAATMVGSLIRFHYGMRQLTVEAGWTRTPADGFIRGGGLACARLAHFGMAKHNTD